MRHLARHGQSMRRACPEEEDVDLLRPEAALRAEELRRQAAEGGSLLSAEDLPYAARQPKRENRGAVGLGVGQNGRPVF